MDQGGCSFLSEKIWEEAQRVFAGGVNSPVRASIKPYPFYVKAGKGPFLFTLDGRKLIDYVLAYGPLILGHAHPKVVDRIKQAIEDGWIFGTPTKIEIDLAKKILGYVKKDKIRFVNSGTEATLLALRLARAYTKRKKILKFDGNYHGAHDFLLVDAGSAASEYNVPISDGVPDEVVRLTEICDYNNIECVENKLKTEEIAAVIVEPVAGNFGLILPEIEFLRGLRELTKNYGSLLIFDEVITGFRLGLGGAQEYFKVTADIITLGKIIGGGFPIGAVSSSAEIIDMLTPKGKVFNAGTFNAHPISMIAGLSTLEVLETGRIYDIANSASKAISSELENSYNGKFVINRIASIFQIFFDVQQVRNAKDVRRANKEKYVKFAQELLKRDVFIPHSQFEVIFTSGTHEDDVVTRTIDAMREAIKSI